MCPVSKNGWLKLPVNGVAAATSGGACSNHLPAGEPSKLFGIVAAPHFSMTDTAALAVMNLTSKSVHSCDSSKEPVMIYYSLSCTRAPLNALMSVTFFFFFFPGGGKFFY